MRWLGLTVMVAALAAAALAPVASAASAAPEGVGLVDGNVTDEVGLHPSSKGFVYFRFSPTRGNADRDFFYGNGGYMVVAGDRTGDGFGTVGLFRPWPLPGER